MHKKLILLMSATDVSSLSTMAELTSPTIAEDRLYWSASRACPPATTVMRVLAQHVAELLGLIASRINERTDYSAVDKT